MIRLETNVPEIKNAHFYFRTEYDCRLFKTVLKQHNIDIPWKRPMYGKDYTNQMTDREVKFYNDYANSSGGSIALAVLDWAYAFMEINNPGMNGYQRDMKSMLERRAAINANNE